MLSIPGVVILPEVESYFENVEMLDVQCTQVPITVLLLLWLHTRFIIEEERIEQMKI
jgi:hypothetical protein